MKNPDAAKEKLEEINRQRILVSFLDHLNICHLGHRRAPPPSQKNGCERGFRF